MTPHEYVLAELAKIDRLYSPDPAIRERAWREEPPKEFMTWEQISRGAPGEVTEHHWSPPDRIAIARESEFGLNQ